MTRTLRPGRRRPRPDARRPHEPRVRARKMNPLAPPTRRPAGLPDAVTGSGVIIVGLFGTHARGVKLVRRDLDAEARARPRGRHADHPAARSRRDGPRSVRRSINQAVDDHPPARRRLRRLRGGDHQPGHQQHRRRPSPASRTTTRSSASATSAQIEFRPVLVAGAPTPTRRPPPTRGRPTDGGRRRRTAGRGDPDA